jgi:hypothetical protein
MPSNQLVPTTDLANNRICSNTQLGGQNEARLCCEVAVQVCCVIIVYVRCVVAVNVHCVVRCVVNCIVHCGVHCGNYCGVYGVVARTHFCVVVGIILLTND